MDMVFSLFRRAPRGRVDCNSIVIALLLLHNCRAPRGRVD